MSHAGESLASVFLAKIDPQCGPAVQWPNGQLRGLATARCSRNGRDPYLGHLAICDHLDNDNHLHKVVRLEKDSVTDLPS